MLVFLSIYDPKEHSVKTEMVRGKLWENRGNLSEKQNRHQEGRDASDVAR